MAGSVYDPFQDSRPSVDIEGGRRPSPMLKHHCEGYEGLKGMTHRTALGEADTVMFFP